MLRQAFTTLRLMNRQYGVNARELGDELGISPENASTWLRAASEAMEPDGGLDVWEEEGAGPGRPALRYRLRRT